MCSPSELRDKVLTFYLKKGYNVSQAEFIAEKVVKKVFKNGRRT